MILKIVLLIVSHIMLASCLSKNSGDHSSSYYHSKLEPFKNLVYANLNQEEVQVDGIFVLEDGFLIKLVDDKIYNQNIKNEIIYLGSIWHPFEAKIYIIYTDKTFEELLIYFFNTIDDVVSENDFKQVSIDGVSISATDTKSGPIAVATIIHKLEDDEFEMFKSFIEGIQIKGLDTEFKYERE